MSAYKWLAFAFGIPLVAGLLALMYEIANPAIAFMREQSSSEYSSTGIDWFAQIIDFMPLVVLLLLAFMLLVGIINRRKRTMP